MGKPLNELPLQGWSRWCRPRLEKAQTGYKLLKWPGCGRLCTQNGFAKRLYLWILYIYHYISVFIHLVICACMHASICTYKLLCFFKYILCVYNIYIYKFMGHGQYFAYSSKSSIFEECTIYRFSGLGNIANVIVFWRVYYRFPNPSAFSKK